MTTKGQFTQKIHFLSCIIYALKQIGTLSKGIYLLLLLRYKQIYSKSIKRNSNFNGAFSEYLVTKRVVAQFFKANV